MLSIELSNSHSFTRKWRIQTLLNLSLFINLLHIYISIYPHFNDLVCQNPSNNNYSSLIMIQLFIHYVIIIIIILISLFYGSDLYPRSECVFLLWMRKSMNVDEDLWLGLDRRTFLFVSPEYLMIRCRLIWTCTCSNPVPTIALRNWFGIVVRKYLIRTLHCLELWSVEDFSY